MTSSFVNNQTIKKSILAFTIFFLIPLLNSANPSTPPPDTISIDSLDQSISKYVNLIDLIDIVRIISRKPIRKIETVEEKKLGHIYFSLLPAFGFSTFTGAVGALAFNAAFYNDKSISSKLSTITSNLVYTQYHQILLPLQVNIWTDQNKYNIVSDWRFNQSPQYTYGLGSKTTVDDKFGVDYTYFRFYTTCFRRVLGSNFIGIGYNYERFSNVNSNHDNPDQVTAYQTVFDQTYGTVQQTSGLTLNYLYDSRTNRINSEKGTYLRFVVDPNLAALGNKETWTFLSLDARKFIKLPLSNKETILAFWSLDMFSIGNSIPYFSLPSTASDDYNNAGRGYVQGRFRGKNMLYFETEIRQQLSANGLLGAVMFFNVQSFSEPTSTNQLGGFQMINPAAGLGLRVKVNKFSKTNVALDFGFGANGSSGIFVNLGEVF